MTLQALRAKVGVPNSSPLCGLVPANRDGNVTTADFIPRAKRGAGEQLDAFFRVWLFEEGKPQSW